MTPLSAAARRTVLIVDDEVGMREMLAWSLCAREFEMVLARDGAEALEMLAARRIDLIVTDLTMPRLNGFGLLAAARGRAPAIPVIVVTGFGTVEMAVHAMRGGASDFILKPFDVAVLVERMHQVLDETSIGVQ